jgi:signal peptidase I
MKTLRWLAAGLLAVVLLSALGTGLALWHSGYRLYAVQTGSMTPTYEPGDVVIDEPPSSEYAAGDVVTFRAHGGAAAVTTHRVHAVTDEGIETKGDANRTPDVSPVDPASIVGRVVADVPRAGYVLVFFQQPAGVGAVVTAMLSIVLLWGMFFPNREVAPAVGAA